MPNYRHLFFDLDNTLWNFTDNARSALFDVYTHYNLDQYYPEFDSYVKQFEDNNTVLWRLYGADKITKDFLNSERFLSPLRPFGILNESLAREMCAFYLDQCCQKIAVMPNTFVTLDYLKAHYNLYIISNGFREVQYKKLNNSGLSGYFKNIFLSEEIGYHKPKPEFFAHLFAVTDATKQGSLVIGDNFEADIEGAMNFGIDQVYFATNLSESHCKRPTYTIHDLSELCQFL
ncbi:MAG: noncanonical pyrimidine nucleotidase, YjjG family [Bacteroidetes bacterium]|nr:noncanonical pyrimidine nucleotidase, YjjG family [Bacteroidota bacterium]